MSLFRVLRGNDANLPEKLTDGYAYFTSDQHYFYIDYLSADGNLVRSKLSAEFADKLRYTDDGETIELDPAELALKSELFSGDYNDLDNKPTIPTTAAEVGALPISGGTLTGDLTGKFITGTWFRSTDDNHMTANATKVCVQDVNGWVYSRTVSELADDIGVPANTSQLNNDSGYITESEIDSKFGAGNVLATAVVT